VAAGGVVWGTVAAHWGLRVALVSAGAGTLDTLVSAVFPSNAISVMTLESDT
jgi:hypothetical protein